MGMAIDTNGDGLCRSTVLKIEIEKGHRRCAATQRFPGTGDFLYWPLRSIVTCVLLAVPELHENRRYRS
jgi:hypothetical protein